MEKELEPDVIKATQTSLGKYVKRPPLTEKLLKKPPFRFLHDIVSTVHKTTGFFKGLFEEDELISENVKDRDSKIVFLNKVITVIGTTTGKSLSVKSSKIVAGQEPEKTNELLQCLALALDKKLSSDEAVRKYKDNVKQTAPTDIKTNEKSNTIKYALKGNDIKKVSSKSSEKLTSNKEDIAVNKNDKAAISESKTKRKENSSVKNDIQTKKLQQTTNKKNTSVTNKTASIQQIPVDSKRDQNVIESKKELSKKQASEPLTIISKPAKPRAEELVKMTAKDLIINNTDQKSECNLNNSSTTVENEFNSSLSSQDLMEVENTNKDTEEGVEKSFVFQSQDDLVQNDTISINEKTPLLAKTIEPILPSHDSTESVDRNGAKEMILKDDNSSSIHLKNHTDVVRPTSVRPCSSRPGAPRLREKIDNMISDTDNILLAKVNIITENAQNEDEEEPSVIIVEKNTKSDKSSVDNPNQLQLLSNEHGHLVQQILDSQKEFSQGGKTEIEWQLGAQKEMVNQEIEQLRYNIQALSRVANPLGKLLDHIQEDAEVMRQELQQWTKVYEEVFKDMHVQKTANEERLVPLQTRIKQLDVDIQEKHDRIDDLNIIIHKNAARIDKLLINNGNVQ